MAKLNYLTRTALFIADVLVSVNLNTFLKKHGITDKRYATRLIDSGWC